MSQQLFSLLFCFVEALISNIPGAVGRSLRNRYYRLRLAEMGSGVVIDCGVRIVNPGWVKIGANTWIDNYVVILAGKPNPNRGAFFRKAELDGVREGEVRIGDNCHISPFVVLQGHGGLTIGSDSSVASGSKIYSLSHHYRNLADPTDRKIYKFSSMAPIDEQSLISASVRVGRNTAIGLNSVLLPGTEIGEGAWISSGSVVMGRVEKNTVYGAPVKSILREIDRSGATGNNIL
ncbi:hypothetical protein NKH41_21740 [Mesorhizobium sp. M1169]|uniref:acyltransferase n=1 Tax=Mesorhizobium sp. M1169 TaxID=2957066 RepID=UPI00333B1768